MGRANDLLLVGAAGIELEALSGRERVAAGDERESAAEILSVAKDLEVVGAAGIEPATLGLEIPCSIHLSYAPTNRRTLQH